jgi:hypothetical protein
MGISCTDCGDGGWDRDKFTEDVFLDGVLDADVTTRRVLLSEAEERRPIVLHVEGEVALAILGHVECLVLLLLVGKALGISLNDFASHKRIHRLLVRRRTTT